MATLTLRLDPEQSNQLEELKRFLHSGTGSGAISEILADYIRLKKERDQLANTVASFRRCEESLRAALESVSQQSLDF